MDLQFEQQQNKIISSFSKQLNRTYDWFDINFTENLEIGSSDFWNTEISAKLMGICENVNLLSSQDEYFVTKIRLNKERAIFIRLSKQIVRELLQDSIGDSPFNKHFELEKITELEAKILTGFNNYLYKYFCEILIPPSEIPQNTVNYNECILTFFLMNKERPIGKMIVTVPVIAVKPEKLRVRHRFSIDDFKNCPARFNISVGKTKIKLNDIKQLEPGDIVVLEDSNIKRMTLIYKNKTLKFKVVPNPALIKDFDYDGGRHMDENSENNFNMWDTIQVDMGAEFEKVKISLGELKQMSEGLVVDIGSVYENKIDLKVENKIIASGELVIINDRYGVRIDEIYTDDKEDSPQESHPDETQSDETIENSPENVVETPTGEEDFDYSDFDVEEEDI